MGLTRNLLRRFVEASKECKAGWPITSYRQFSPESHPWNSESMSVGSRLQNKMWPWRIKGRFSQRAELGLRDRWFNHGADSTISVESPHHSCPIGFRVCHGPLIILRSYCSYPASFPHTVDWGCWRQINSMVPWGATYETDRRIKITQTECSNWVKSWGRNDPSKWSIYLMKSMGIGNLKMWTVEDYMSQDQLWKTNYFKQRCLIHLIRNLKDSG